MNSHETDETILEAMSRLITAGFTVLTERGPDQSGNRLIEMDLDECRIRLGIEYGQHFVEMWAPGGATSPDMGLWAACLDQADPSLAPGDVLEDVDWLIRRLPEVQHLLAQGGIALEECLRSAGMWRFRARREAGLIEYPTTD
jgi:hypothetical protein